MTFTNCSNTPRIVFLIYSGSGMRAMTTQKARRRSGGIRVRLERPVSSVKLGFLLRLASHRICSCSSVMANKIFSISCSTYRISNSSLRNTERLEYPWRFIAQSQSQHRLSKPIPIPVSPPRPVTLPVNQHPWPPASTHNQSVDLPRRARISLYRPRSQPSFRIPLRPVNGIKGRR